MRFQTLLLDWDGCMANTLAVWMSAYKTVYARYGVACSEKEIVAKSWGNLELGPKNFCIDDFISAWREIVGEVRTNLPKVKLYPQVLNTLTKLKTMKVKMAVVTSSERSVVEPAIKSNKLGSLIDLLVTEEDVSRPKPDPEMLYLAMKRLEETKNDQSLIVGDTGKDIVAGKAAGISTVLVLHPQNERFYDFSKLRLANPDFVIEAFEQLIRIF